MPRLAFPAQEDGRHRKAPTDADRTLFVVKFAAIVIIGGLVGGFLLLSGSDDSGDQSTRPQAAGAPRTTTSPPVPTTTTPPASTAGPSAGTSSAAELIPPLAHSATAVMSPSKRPSRPRSRPPGRGQTYAVVGKPCDRPGSYSLTKQYQPVVCRGSRPTWQPVF